MAPSGTGQVTSGHWDPHGRTASDSSGDAELKERRACGVGGGGRSGWDLGAVRLKGTGWLIHMIVVVARGWASWASWAAGRIGSASSRDGGEQERKEEKIRDGRVGGQKRERPRKHEHDHEHEREHEHLIEQAPKSNPASCAPPSTFHFQPAGRQAHFAHCTFVEEGENVTSHDYCTRTLNCFQFRWRGSPVVQVVQVRRTKCHFCSEAGRTRTQLPFGGVWLGAVRDLRHHRLWLWSTRVVTVHGLRSWLRVRS